MKLNSLFLESLLGLKVTLIKYDAFVLEKFFFTKKQYHFPIMKTSIEKCYYISLNEYFIHQQVSNSTWPDTM